MQARTVPDDWPVELEEGDVVLEGVGGVVALVRDDLGGDEVLRLGRALVLRPAVERRAQGVLAHSHARPAIGGKGASMNDVHIEWGGGG